MPAQAQVRPRERAIALAAVAFVQLALALVLLNGLKVEVGVSAEAVQRLIEIALPRTPPPPPPPQLAPKAEVRQSSSSAPKALPKLMGGTPGPKPSHALPAPTPVVAVRPAAPASGGGSGTGPAIGSGAGGGSGGQGYGGDDGGTDLVQIAGSIGNSDYPRHLLGSGVGGRVEFTFTVEPNGRVGRCTVTRSSGVPELDALTCRLVQQRFVYRPSTDRYGRPIEDEVDGVYDWNPR